MVSAASTPRGGRQRRRGRPGRRADLRQQARLSGEARPRDHRRRCVGLRRRRDPGRLRAGRHAPPQADDRIRAQGSRPGRAGRRDLPRRLDPGVGRNRQGPQRDLRRADQGRRDPRRRQVCRSGGGARQEHHHLAAAERPAGVLQGDRELSPGIAAHPQQRQGAQAVERPCAVVADLYHVAEFTMGPRGVASADYTGVVKTGERVL